MTMRRQKPEARLLCYASIIALSLSACSQHGGKLKNETNIPDNARPASTSDNKKNRFSASSKNSGRWLRKKDRSLASTGGTKSSSQYDNLWDRLFDLYDLPPLEHGDIDRELEWFVNHPSYIDRVQNRAEPFLYSIVKQVEKHDIPGEIALLPVIESAFQPHAVSPANAAGIWQFIPSTGRIYGLKRSRTYDGRRDVYASTKAAIKYLKKLHSDFNGDWLLAIAAYNCGEGAVARAIQKNLARNLPADFWSLDLPQETRSYVPRLLAVAKLFADADQYGIELHQIPNSARYKPVKVSTQLDLALAADAADISLDELHELNPGFKGQFADVEGSYHLFIPAKKKTSEFRQELERLVLEGRSYEQYQPLPEETPVEAKDSMLASAESTEAGVPARTVSFEENLSDASFQRERRESAREKNHAGGREQVEEKFAHHPSRTGAGRDRRGAEVVSIERAADRSSGKKATYTVQRGETLWAVARKHSVDVEQLAKWNNFSERTAVRAGQTLVVWNKDAGKKLPLMNAGFRPSQSIKYTVREGDTLFSISRRFKVTVADLRKWNGSNIEKHIQPGKNITVQKD
jgi:membrane-bound lytic murein transglycosylase D